MYGTETVIYIGKTRVVREVGFVFGEVRQVKNQPMIRQINKFIRDKRNKKEEFSAKSRISEKKN